MHHIYTGRWTRKSSLQYFDLLTLMLCRTQDTCRVVLHVSVGHYATITMQLKGSNIACRIYLAIAEPNTYALCPVGQPREDLSTVNDRPKSVGLNARTCAD